METDEICLNCMGQKDRHRHCPNCEWMEGQQMEPGQQLPAGTILHGKYLLGRVLGHGGFGITYLALDLTLNVRLAIKEFLPREFAVRHPGHEELSFINSETHELFAHGLEKYLDEAKTLAQFIEYQGIVSVRDYFSENGTAYLVMNYVEGLTLKDYLLQKGSKLDLNTALQIMLPVMDALCAVHKKGIMHRDVSLDNIYINSNGIVKLLDFGAARHAMGQNSRSMSVIIKNGFAPCEQYSSRGNQGLGQMFTG